MDPQILVDAFRDAKLIGKDETLRLVERASRVGAGWSITVDLRATRKATVRFGHHRDGWTTLRTCVMNRAYRFGVMCPFRV
jgi:hypothetical protein